MNNKFKNEDIVYYVNVTECLVVDINKLIVKNFFFNHLPQYNKFIYSCDAIEQIIIRDYELPLKENELDSDYSKRQRNPATVISTSTSEEFLYSKEELTDIIPILINERKAMNQRVAEAAEKFRCPLTNEKMCYDNSRQDYILDGPSYYKVENSKIVWEKWPFGDGIYETEIDGVKHQFKYLEDGNWEKYDLKTDL